MLEAWSKLGVSEYIGPADNPQIVEFHAACDDSVSDDEVPWCSSYVNWCIAPYFEPTRSRAARSWLLWGVELKVPAYGCVCVLWREAVDSWKGHVGFWLGEIGNDVLLLSGNTSNEVTARRFPKDRVLGYRYI
jgi:uncharacterized protein (TIGR02594 family)